MCNEGLVTSRGQPSHPERPGGDVASRGRTALDSTALKTDLPRQDLDTHQEERIRIDPYGQQAEHPKADD